ncbi:MAG: nicotinamide mononucleotide transporter [Candidatus Kapaibacteriales bacterium]
MEDLTRYFLIDWLAMLLSLLGVYIIGNKRKSGFLVFALSNVIWALLGFTLMGSYGVAIGNLIFVVINIRGYLSWNKKETVNNSIKEA